MKNNKQTGKLPFGIKKSDLGYPKDYKDSILHYIDIYEVERFGWVVATLPIGGSSRRSGYAQRTYAVTADGKVCRVGKGPHVKQTIKVYVAKSRAKDLSELVELYTNGAVKANTIRDRISSRRAQGQLNRMNGLTSWRW